MGIEIAKAFVTISVDSAGLRSGLTAAQGSLDNALDAMMSKASTASGQLLLPFEKVSQGIELVGRSGEQALLPFNRTLIATRSHISQASAATFGFRDAIKSTVPATFTLRDAVQITGTGVNRLDAEFAKARDNFMAMRNLSRALAEDLEDVARAENSVAVGAKRMSTGMKGAATGNRALQREEKRVVKQTGAMTAGLNQAVFGVQDFVQVIGQPGLGLTQALRASANNMQQVASVTLPSLIKSFFSAEAAASKFVVGLAGGITAGAGLALAFVPMIANMITFGDETDDAGDKLDDFNSKLKKVVQNLNRLREEQFVIKFGQEAQDVGDVRAEAAQTKEGLEATRRQKIGEKVRELKELDKLDLEAKRILKIREEIDEEGQTPFARADTIGLRRLAVVNKEIEESKNRILKLSEEIAEKDTAIAKAVADFEGKKDRVAADAAEERNKRFKKSIDVLKTGLTDFYDKLKKEVEKQQKEQDALQSKLSKEGRTRLELLEIHLESLRAQAIEKDLVKDFNDGLERRGELLDSQLDKFQKQKDKVGEKTKDKLKGLSFKGDFAGLNDAAAGIIERQGKIFEDQLAALAKIEENTRKVREEKLAGEAKRIPII